MGKLRRWKDIVLLAGSRTKLPFYALTTAKIGRLALLAFLSIGGPAMAQGVKLSPEDAIVRLFSEGPIQAEWFTTEFVAVAPPPRIQNIVEGLTSEFGSLLSVHLDGRAGIIQLERAIVPVEISLDGAGRIAGLLFQPPQPTEKGARSIGEAILGAASGEVAVLAAKYGSDGRWHHYISHRPDEPMAVGSAFKLAVLRVYEDAIAVGKLNRSDVITLHADDRSLPSGVLQAMQPGVPITLEALAGLMIQQSDNTATDALLRILGRELIEETSARNRPFLTTGEFFRLIAPSGESERSNFLRGDDDDRRRILANMAGTPLPNAQSLLPRATWPDVEWYFTATELCDLMLSLEEAPALNGQPDPLVASDGWRNVRFKGGSEFGVLNLSAAGKTPDDQEVCVVVTANGEDAQAEDKIALLFGALFRSMATLP